MRSDKRGQSLLETIVALGVIITGLGGAISLMTYNLRSSQTTINQLVAQELATEGIEVVTNIRDSNFLAGSAYDTGLNGGSDQTAIPVFNETNNTWSVDFSANAITDASAVLYQQGGVYRQASSTPSGTASPFKRLLTIQHISADQIHVLSQVQWTQNGRVQNVQIERDLYNWK